MSIFLQFFHSLNGLPCEKFLLFDAIGTNSKIFILDRYERIQDAEDIRVLGLSRTLCWFIFKRVQGQHG
jgi:hypothetical protein